VLIVSKPVAGNAIPLDAARIRFIYNLEPGGGRWMMKRRRVAALALAAAALAFTACGADGDWEENRPPPIPADSSALQTFLSRCARGIAQWSGQGQVDYPPVLHLHMDRASTYAAAVDVRDHPAPADELVQGGKADPISVKCIVGARLIPTDTDIVDVALPDTARDGGWVYREFTPTGVLQWSWSVTARAPHDSDLTLELRPSIRREADGAIVADAEQTTEQRTRVEVTAGMVQRGSSWVDENKGYVAVLGAALITFLLWLLRTIADVREEGRQAFPEGTSRRRRRSPRSADGWTHPPEVRTGADGQGDPGRGAEPSPTD
jgi:hypothetical protein